MLCSYVLSYVLPLACLKSFTGLTNMTRFPMTNVYDLLRYYFIPTSINRYFRNLHSCRDYTRVRYDKTVIKKLHNVTHVYVGNVLLSPKYWRIFIYTNAFEIKLGSIYFESHETYYSRLFRLQNTHKRLFQWKSFLYY